jgi:hypothetical protein
MLKILFLSNFLFLWGKKITDLYIRHIYFPSRLVKKQRHACSPKFHFDVYLQTRFSMHVKVSFASKEKKILLNTSP